MCPITATVISQTPPGVDWLEANGSHWFEDGYSLYFKREGLFELPVVDLATALTEYSGEYIDWQQYDPGNNDRGVCIAGRYQKTSDAVMEPSSEQLDQYYMKYPSSCKNSDDRYILWDNYELETLFLSTLKEQVSECANLPVYSLSDPRYVQSEDPDYYYSGIACGSDGRTCYR
jgi:hypothetical protein